MSLTNVINSDNEAHWITYSGCITLSNQFNTKYYGKAKRKISSDHRGAGGIGSATARLFAREGAKVLLVDLNEDTLKKVVGELDHPNISYVAADVSQASADIFF